VIIPTKKYPIHISRGSLDRVGQLVSSRGRVFVVTAPGLHEFGERVARSFEPRATILLMDDGETNKTIGTAGTIVDQLIEHNAKRDSMVVAVGGGVVGDVAGFAAAIFLRGIDLVQVPTTLLAQVDSAYGGKVGVNHPKGKNLIGAFHPPRAVIVDPEVLKSLPPHQIRSGMFEALKGGVLGDSGLFELFEQRRDDVDRIIERAVRVKTAIVDSDEREKDLRRLLNYGHTIAHGIEAAMHYDGITHGEAVGWGMIGANEIAVRRGVLDDATRRRIDRTIRAWAPSPLPPTIDRNAILAATEHDKKNTGATRVMVLPTDIGSCEVVEGITEDEVAIGIDAVVGRV
jgi:3-dehydroquinate synthase